MPVHRSKTILVQISAALLSHGFKTEELHLHGSEKVGGYIASRRFLGVPQPARQQMLSEALSKIDQRRISAILTVTPEEIEEDD